MAVLRNLDASTGLVAVSLAKQTDAETAATLARSWSEIDGSIITSVDPFIAVLSNRGGLGGQREPDQFAAGNIEPFDITFSFGNKFGVNCDQLAWMIAYVTGGAAAAADEYGSLGLYCHEATMRAASVLELPYFSALFMRGDETNGLDKIFLYGLQGQTFTLSWDRKNPFLTASLSAQALGKYKRNILRDIVWAASSATTVTLSADAVEGASAAARLKSIHAVIADLGGLDGRNWKELVPTVASDAAPCAITVPKAIGPLTSVFKDVSGVYTDYNDGSSTIVANLTATANMLYIGHTDKFSAIDWTTSVANDVAATIDVEYLKDDGAWTNVGDLVDHTLDTATGTKTLGQTGTIFWNKMTDWEPCMLPYSAKATTTIPRQALYWVRLKGSGTLTETTAGTVAQSTYREAYKVQFDDNGTYTDYTAYAAAMDGDEFPAVTITTAEDNVYIGAKTPFARFYVEIGDTPNATAATTMAIKYYKYATGFTAVSGQSDGTMPAAVSMAQNGAVTFTQPTDWVKSTVNSIEAYWLQVSWDKTLTVGAYIEGIRIGTEYLPFEVIYRTKESTDFTEGDTVPAETLQPPLPTSGLQFFVNPDFDGYRMSGGIQLGCDHSSGSFEFANNNPAPSHCMDGTLDKFAKRHIMGCPTQKVKLSLEANAATWELMNEFSCDSTSYTVATTETTRFVSCGLRCVGPVIDPAISTDLRYMVEFYWPKAVLSAHKRTETDGRYSMDLEFDIGEDTVNSYYSFYSFITSDVSTAYAQ